MATQVAGVVQTIDFTANQQVKQGDLLVQIDDAVERADLMSAQAAVERDRTAMERALSLRKTGVNSDAAVEEASSALAASQSIARKDPRRPRPEGDRGAVCRHDRHSAHRCRSVSASG